MIVSSWQLFIWLYVSSYDYEMHLILITGAYINNLIRSWGKRKALSRLKTLTWDLHAYNRAFLQSPGYCMYAHELRSWMWKSCRISRTYFSFTDMRAFCFLTFWFLLTAITNVRSVNVIVENSHETVGHQRRSKDTTEPVTKVFSHIPCESSLAEEDKIGKKRLDEIHTFAELKHDPRASLPDSFTVCSTMMTTSCRNYVWPAFFTILDENRTQFLAPIISRWTIKSALQVLYLQGMSERVIGKIPGCKILGCKVVWWKCLHHTR